MAMINDMNCRNCGVPVEPGRRCAYCGTMRPEEIRSEINITATGITLSRENIGRIPDMATVLYADDRIVGYEE